MTPILTTAFAHAVDLSLASSQILLQVFRQHSVLSQSLDAGCSGCDPCMPARGLTRVTSSLKGDVKEEKSGLAEGENAAGSCR
jgi:hypothetical protein